MAKKSNNGLLILLVIAGFIAWQSGALSGIGAPAQAAGAQAAGGAVSGAGAGCSLTNQTVTLSGTARNPNNATLYYWNPTMVYTDTNTGAELGSEAMTAGTSKSYSSGKSFNCGAQVTAYVLSSSTYTATKAVVPQLTGTIVYQDFLVPYASEVEFRMQSTSGSNLTAGDGTTDSFGQDQTQTNAQALAASGKYSFDLRYKAKTVGGQFGSNELPTYACADLNTTTYSSGALTCSNPNWKSVPVATVKYCAENAYEVAWQIPTVKYSDGEQLAGFSLTADLGVEPTSASAPKIIFVDSAFFRGSTGVIKSGTSDDTATDVGSTNRYLQTKLS